MAALMIQGCGSDVGKSVLVAGLCRLFAHRAEVLVTVWSEVCPRGD